MQSSPSGPLAGIRVVDMTSFAAGPLATSMLADQGADVIKIERLDGGDGMRSLGSVVRGASPIFATLNRNKRSLAVDVGNPVGVDLIRRLCRTADVFIQNLRPGSIDKLGLGEPVLRGADPQLVYTSISGFGESGPYGDQPAYDAVIQAAAGVAAHQGQVAAGGEPQYVRNALSDKVTGMAAAQLTTAALLARARGLGGQHVRVSMLHATLHFLWSDGLQDVAFLDSESDQTPKATQPPVRRTADGFVAISATSDDDFRGLCAALGLDGLIDDERFCSRTQRFRYTAELTAIIDPAIRSVTTDHLVGALRARGVAHARVSELDRVHEHEQVVHQGLVQIVEQHPAGAMRQPVPVGTFSATPTSLAWPAPRLGQQTDDVLRELGLGSSEIHQLRQDGVIA